MKRSTLLATCVILLLPTFAAGKGISEATQDTSPPAEKSADESTPQEDEMVTVSGRVRLVGSEPFSNLVITDEDGTDWYILDPEDVERLQKSEQRTVTVRGELTVREMTLADGRKLGDRLELSDIEVLES